jgi:translation initiation factor IF-2
MELKAPRSVPARGVVVEAQLSKGLGPIATVILKRGVLKPGDPLIVGTEHGRVRVLRNSTGKTLTEAGPGQAVVVSGLKGLPAAGDELLAVQDEARAAKMAAARSARAEDYRRSQLTRMQAEARRQQQALREQEYERWVGNGRGLWVQR